MTFEGARNNISNTFLCLVLFCGVRDVRWCFWSLGTVSVQLCVILAPNTHYFGEILKVQRSWFQSQKSWFHSQGSLADLTSNLTPTPEVLNEFFKGTQNHSLQHSWIWVLIMWQAGGEVAGSWVLEWKRPACTDCITWFSLILVSWRQKDEKVNLNHSLQWWTRFEASRSHCKYSNKLKRDFQT